MDIRKFTAYLVALSTVSILLYFVLNDNLSSIAGNEDFTEREIITPPGGHFSNRFTNMDEEPLSDADDQATRRCSNTERVWHLRGSCIEDDVTGERPFRSLKPLRYILVDDKRKLLYCSMPKTASTSMKYFLFKLNGIPEKKNQILSYVHNPKRYAQFGYSSLDSYTPEEVEYRLKNYYKYLFVRHPFDRIASTWREKLFYKNIYMPKIARMIIKLYREPGFVPQNGSVFEKVPQLSEFVAYIANHNGTWNEHWDAIELMCEPCRVRYDYIVRLESLDDDLDDILALHGRNLSLTEHENLSHVEVPLQSKVKADAFIDVDSEVLKKLLKIYADDFRRFGYGFTDDTEFECSISTPRGSCC